MKVSILALATAVTPGAPHVIGGNSEGAIFTRFQEITCDQKHSTIYPNTDDASGIKLGLRTVPGNIVDPPFYRNPLDIVEFNTGKIGDGRPGHQTIYKDRGYAMFNVEGQKTGQCYLDRSFTFNLNCPDDGQTIVLEGSSMFRCETNLKVVFD
ncbi:hypothetical protein F5B19DRAFT_492930 [Rostrohypoxylon terebratum]|nr:hypothetical protein F5B19DRAFT_492930 [Rostrohypoxylon terebratum]